MADALSVTEISMMNDMLRMKAISDNLANVGTSGFRKNVVNVTAFSDMLAANTAYRDVTVAVPLLTVTKDPAAGTFGFTGNPLDLAVEEGMYFELLTDTGPVYTRKGNFRLDPQGRLVTAEGVPVGAREGEVMLTGSEPVVRQNGEIWEGDRRVAQLRIVGFDGDVPMRSLGAGMYLPADLSIPRDAENARVRQGYLETANVEMMSEMVKMIETVRHFESSQKVLQGYDKMLDSALTILGEF